MTVCIYFFFLYNFTCSDSRSLRQRIISDKSKRTYLLEASIHNSNLLAGELGLSQKFFYRYWPGGLLSRPRAFEFEERFFRSRWVRRRCHDFWSSHCLNYRKSTAKLPPISFQLFFCSFYNRWPARSHHRRHVSCHRASFLSIRCRSLDFFLSRSHVYRKRRCKTLFRAGNCKIFPTWYFRAMRSINK